MTQLLREALTKRGRVWGQRNRAVLRALRRGKEPTRSFSIYCKRPVVSLGWGQYITCIPGAP